MRWSPVSDQFESADDVADFENMTLSPGGPIHRLTDIYESPADLFFAVFPRSLLKTIAKESNRYERQTRGQRVVDKIAHQRRRRATDASVIVEEATLIRQQMRMTPAFEAWDIARVLGFLFGNALCTHKDGIRKHWARAGRGGIPAGAFGQVMARNRFEHILRFLHFTDNAAREENGDKVWKIRPVVSVVQDRFRSLWDLTSTLSFDEGVLPSTSRMNTTRMYMPDKPHQWGTKLFMMCDAETSYCFRFESYMGKKQHDLEHPSFDNRTGPAAVVRNLRKVFTDNDMASGDRVVTIDRYYTSVPLLMQLLAMRIYTVGTIMTNRLGFCKDVISKEKRSTKSSLPRGSFKMARSLDVPSMLALSWLDNKPVHFLSTDVAATSSAVSRRMHSGAVEFVRCTKIVSDYHAFVGGVDQHDQLRLQMYALQTTYRFQKYYKSLFMGVVDLVAVNAYVTYVKCCKDAGVTSMKRAQFMMVLHEQLIKQAAHDFFGEDQATPTSTGQGVRHTIQQNDNYRVSGKQRMLRRNACKVWSIQFRKKGEKSNETSWFCVQRSEDHTRLWLCNTIRANQGNSKTCFDIWHQDWRCRVPATATNYIQMRPTGRKKKRVRRLLHEEEIENKTDASD